MATPRLTICVPTYNRADRLRVMLQAALPQVAELGERVELCISDNASTDHTRQVVDEARNLGPFNYSRNETNIGLISNLIKVTTELAQGEFVWLLGDDDLLRPHALERVLKALEANRHLDLINLNFQYSSYDTGWPETALGGYDGPFQEVNPDLTDRPVSHWHELISGRNSMCGQMYVHVIRRSIWQDYWRGRPRQTDFSDARWAYPHSYMIAETVMNQPSYYVGEPVLTIFNGGQSWWESRHSVVFKFPGLLRAYQKNGLPKKQVRECEVMAFRNCEPLLTELLIEEREATRKILAYLRANWRFRECWRVLARAGLTARRPRLIVGLWLFFGRLRNGLRRLINSLRYRGSRLKGKFSHH
jgi:glycosyltransferase involved in cell wall biosynthesis